MNTFLNIVAKDLYARFGRDLSRVAVVFPNRRAGLFFNEYLAHEAEEPIWSPTYLSVKDLFLSLSPLRLADSIELVCRLYKIFIEASHSEETLDDFYFWGELLISDFDDVDKNLVPADKLFSNLKDLRDMSDDLSFLSSEQEEAIHQFFLNFSIEKSTDIKNRFISLWNVLSEIYVRFREQLRTDHLAYEGMLYRDVMEHLDTSELKYDMYVFVGFNVLNKVENGFFSTLRDAGKALFYWDYDTYYLNKSGHEAGEFLKQNLHNFPQSLPRELFDELDKPKRMTFIASTTENAQARYLPEWVRGHLQEKESESAIVLCNESLLLPVLHSLPDEVNNVNVTMGFPLLQTPVYSFISSLIDLQTLGYDAQQGTYTYATVCAVLRHSYTTLLSQEASILLEKDLTTNNRFYPLPTELGTHSFLQKLFVPVQGNAALCTYLLEVLKEVATIYRQEKSSSDMYNQLYRESLFQTYTTLNRVSTLIHSGLLQVSTSTFRRLLTRMLGAINIPFHGEPAIGLQVMGVLETRNLDFRHLILLSLNEGQLPKIGSDASFIPYNLRRAFGMTTIEHKNSVYAYYFYRLIQRAETVTLVYNNATDGPNRREMSRFMLQLLIEWPHPIERRYIQARQQITTVAPIQIAKTPEVMARLINRFRLGNKKWKQLSPSALNTYLNCTLKFYFQYVAGLCSSDDVSTDIDSAMFGTIFHKTAEKIYKEFSDRPITAELLDRLLHDPRKISDRVDDSFRTEFFKLKGNEKIAYNGLQLINSRVIINYIRQLFKNDRRYTPFTIVGTEKPVKEERIIKLCDGQSVTIRVGGIIDRMDLKDGTLRIVDYKTGGQPSYTTDIATLFQPSDKRNGYIFQTFLYASILSKQEDVRIAPSLLYIHRAAGDDYSPVITMGATPKDRQPVMDFHNFQQEFDEQLDNLLQAIFDESVPFSQTELQHSCDYCDFKVLCGK